MAWKFLTGRTLDGSRQTADEFHRDPDSPWLISFPRTGSHWLRMMLETYSDRPLLPRSFFEHFNRDYLLVHSHDYDFSASASRVLYLYRDPTPTVFSQIKFHQRDLFDRQEVELWSTLYRLHLQHWLTRNRQDLTVVRYEDLKADTVNAMIPVLLSLDLPVNRDKLARVITDVSRQKVEERTSHDPRVISREADYEQQRGAFAQRWGDTIRELVIDEGGLHSWFGSTSAPAAQPLREAA